MSGSSGNVGAYPGVFRRPLDSPTRLSYLNPMLPMTASPIDRNALGDGGGVLASGVRVCVREHGAGNRAGRWRDGGSRAGKFRVDHGMQCVMETTDGIGPVRTYAWGLDVAGRVDMSDSPFVSMAGAGAVGGLLAASDLSEAYCYAYDGNGNVMALVDAAGDVAGEYRYGPYGQTRTAAETGIANPFRFSTKFLETAFASENETLSFGGGLDLYDYGFRWYHAQLGRWTARDPLGVKFSRNLYFAFANLPVSVVDIGGLKNWCAYNEDKEKHGWFYAATWDLFGVYDLAPTGDPLADFIAELEARPQRIKKVNELLGEGLEIVGAFNDGADLAIVIDEWSHGDVYAAQFAILLPFVGAGHLKVLDKCGHVLLKVRGQDVDILTTIRTHREMSRVLKGTGLESHHLIERRFAKRLGIHDDGEIEAIAMNALEHRLKPGDNLTTIFRDEIPYRANGDYSDMNPQEIYEAHKKVYTRLGVPELMEPIKHWFEDAGVILD